MILLLAFAVLCVVVGILIGKGMRLNRELRAAQIAAVNSDHDPEALIDMRTGEVLDPGTRRYTRAIKKSRVIFE